MYTKSARSCQKIGKQQKDYEKYLVEPNSIETIKKDTQRYFNFLKKNLYRFSNVCDLLYLLKKWVDDAPGEHAVTTIPLKKRSDRLGAVLESLDESRTAYFAEGMYFVDIKEIYSCFAGVEQRLLDRAYLIKNAEVPDNLTQVDIQAGVFFGDFIETTSVAVNPTDFLYQAYLKAAGYSIHEVDETVFVLKNEPQSFEYEKALSEYTRIKIAVLSKKWHSYISSKEQKNKMPLDLRNQLVILKTELKKYMAENEQVDKICEDNTESLASEQNLKNILAEEFLTNIHKITSDFENIKTIPRQLQQYFLELGELQTTKVAVLIPPSKSVSASLYSDPYEQRKIITKMADIIGFGSSHIEILLTLLGQNIPLGQNLNPISAGLIELDKYAADGISYLDKEKFLKFNHEIWFENAVKKYTEYLALLKKNNRIFHAEYPNLIHVAPYYIELWPPISENLLLIKDIEKDISIFSEEYRNDISICHTDIIIDGIKNNHLLKRESDRSHFLRRFCVTSYENDKEKNIQLYQILLKKGIDFTNRLPLAGFILKYIEHHYEYVRLFWGYFREKPYVKALLSCPATSSSYDKTPLSFCYNLINLGYTIINLDILEKHLLDEQICTMVLSEAAASQNPKVINWIIKNTGLNYDFSELFFTSVKQEYEKITLPTLFLIHGLSSYAQEYLPKTKCLLHSKSAENILALAIKLGDTDFLNLLKCHPDVNLLINCKSSYEEYPLVEAIKKNDMLSFSWLIDDKNANLDITVLGKGLYAYLASEEPEKKESFVIKIFKAGLPVEQDIFIKAVRSGWLNFLNDLFRPELMDYVDPETQEPALITVIKKSEINIALKMIRHGANPHVIDKENKNIWHHLAELDKKIVDDQFELLSGFFCKNINGSLLNALSELGQSPLEVAYRHANTFLINELHKAQAVNSLRGFDAILVFKDLCEKLLLSNALDLLNTFSMKYQREAVNQWLKCGTPLLGYLINKLPWDIDSKLLIPIFAQAGVDFCDQANHDGYHSLSFAIKKGKVDTAKAILAFANTKKIMNISYIQNFGCRKTTALQHAISLNHIELSEIFVNADAFFDMNILSFLSKESPVAIIRLLIDNLLKKGYSLQEILLSFITCDNITIEAFEAAIEHIPKFDVSESELERYFDSALESENAPNIWQQLIELFDVDMDFFRRNKTQGKTFFERCFCEQSTVIESACAIVLLQNGFRYNQAEEDVISMFFYGYSTLNNHFRELLNKKEFTKAFKLIAQGARGLSEDFIAAFNANDTQKTALLLVSGVSIPQKENSETYLMQAVRQGNIMMVKILLAAGQENLFYQNAQGQTVFALANQHKNDKIIRLLEQEFEFQESRLYAPIKKAITFFMPKEEVGKKYAYSL